MNKILFSIVMIARNEANVLPRLISSLKEFQQKNGEVVLLDTGSKDDTVKIAKDAGFKVTEVGEKYLHKIDKSLANKINKKFIVEGEEPIVKEGDTYFDFASARNHAASLAKNDIVFFYDADEVAARLDIDKINEFIEQGYNSFEYEFIFAFDAFGNEAVKFRQSKSYDRRLQCWNGIIHELIIAINPEKEAEVKRMYLDESVYKLAHYQNHETGRHSYLKGLSVDCFNHPKNERHSHYLSREIFWSGRPKSALKEFKNHISFGGWLQERAESMIFIGDIYGQLNNPDEQVRWYFKSFHTDDSRRVALLKLAWFYLYNKNYQAASCFSKASLEIPYNGFYATNMSQYTTEPSEILYESYGWLGKIEEAKEHLLKCLDYQPHNRKYQEATKYFFEFPVPDIDGWMSYRELLFLYETAKKYNTINEVGSWKGRSTTALAKGCKGTVTAIDTWNGSEFELDHTNFLAKEEDVFAVFLENTKDLKNLKTIRAKSVDAAKQIPEQSVEMTFIDAGHRREDVIEDVLAHLPKTTKFICGHDYKKEVWLGVVEAVDEIFGTVDGVEDTIWWVDLTKRERNADGTLKSNVSENKANKRIPKKIYTAWLSEDNEIPELIRKCIESQKIEGYEHHVITLEEVKEKYAFSSPLNKYIQDAVAAKKWVKVVDAIRMDYLINEGGIFLDADVEILEGKNFDSFLYNRMFACFEANGFIGTAIIGAEKEYPFIKKWMQVVLEKFKGDDDKNFESSMELLTNGYWVDSYYKDPEDAFKVYPKEIFCPYDHIKDKDYRNENTITVHHFLKSWVNEKTSPTLIYLPTVSFIIPQLGREEGLKKCIDSIKELNYPQELIDIKIIEGDETVPVKVNKGVRETTGELICYAANDVVFEKESLIKAAEASKDYALVAFNTGDVYDDLGNIAEHFLAKRSFVINDLKGQLFDEEFSHVGSDNFLWQQASLIGQAVRCDDAIVYHNHFSKGAEFDEVYQKGWSQVEKDRKKLKSKMLSLNNKKTNHVIN